MNNKNDDLLKEMLESPLQKVRLDDKIQIRSTSEELQMYKDLMKADFDIPLMVRMFITSLHRRFIR